MTHAPLSPFLCTQRVKDGEISQEEAVRIIDEKEQQLAEEKAAASTAPQVSKKICRETETERSRERSRDGERECVCVCFP